MSFSYFIFGFVVFCDPALAVAGCLQSFDFKCAIPVVSSLRRTKDAAQDIPGDSF
jgi:hypothetical protein